MGDKKKQLDGRRHKPKNFWSTLGRFIKYMATRKWTFLLIIILIVLSTIFQIVSPRILGQATTLITDGVSNGLQNVDGQEMFIIDYTGLAKILATVVTFYITSAIFNFLQGVLLSRTSQHVIEDLRNDMRAKLNRLPISFLDATPNGEIMSRAINDVENVGMTLQQTLQQVLMSATQFILTLVMMTLISPKMTLIAAGTIILSTIIMLSVTPVSQKLFAAQQRVQGNLNAYIEENYSGQVENNAFNQNTHKIDQFKAKSDEYYEISWKAQFISGILMPLMNLAKNFGYVAVAIVGGFSVANGTMPIGDVQAMLQYAGILSEPLKQTANMINQLQRMVASIERIFEFLDVAEMEEEASNIPAIDTEYKMIFENVQFGYDEGAENLLMHDFNLKVKPGQMVAIVGPTGAGKSTIINLIERFYNVSGGSIKFEGVDTRDISQEDLRAKMGMVLQDTWLFNGTIAENIAYGSHKDHITRQDVVRAAQAAHVDDFVRKLPNGYDTVINQDGSNMSQGQRQLLTIARAFMSDPEILILDEATSSIDTRTEKLIQKAMSQLLEGRTSFVVAHRLSTIQDADNIIVLNHGDVIETGNHFELLAQKGFYYNLYNAQFVNGEFE
ncbi:ABC transporter ATP-binding protein [Aerococcus sp. 1KP-2016]|uniref:ABC transporter ATP-binding protein n=1 Tax=Aerococcus sp. 1KP-2016 TaxID=1981982 RepID=UPI000B983C3A|nr:ABC transporter ATP-binding protein [Aerococcus sp. 1KP-2016]OYQ67604.1 multidrug ABC transporter ATP-binding protein [Aerococcus sp. 1KP-2016]